MDFHGDDVGLLCRFESYVEALAGCLGHLDRHEPFREYCTGLLLPGDRKSVEPMAARLSPSTVSAKHQSLLHFVGQSPWSSVALLAAVRRSVLPSLEARGPVEAWIVDDTSFPKKGKHSVGVSRQYSGVLGKQDNCQVAVSLSLASAEASLPVAWQLYLPQAWAEDSARRRTAKVPDEVAFHTKPEIALAQIAALAGDASVPRGVVLADAGYGHDARLRDGLDGLGLCYVMGILSKTLLFAPATTGRSGTAPLAARAVAEGLPAAAWREVSWREGATGEPLTSRFATLRVCAVRRDGKRVTPKPETWLMVEWPDDEDEPTKYWLSNLPAHTEPSRLVYLAKHRWLIERDYQELKQELGLGHYEGRGWPGFHHHAALAIAAYGFLLKERIAIPPSAAHQRAVLQAPTLPNSFRPRGAPDPARATPAGLDRHSPSTDRSRAHPETQPMSMLSAKNPDPKQNGIQFMTQ